MRRAFGLLLIALPLTACVKHLSSPTGGGRIDGLTLDLVSPTILGTAADPINATSATINLSAKDDQGNLVTDQDTDVDLYLASGGIRTGQLTGCSVKEAAKTPIATVHLDQGVALNYQLALPNAFGASSIWAEIPAAGAAGASPVINFRNPYISDISKPLDLTAQNAAFCSPYNGKFVRIDQATGSGKLVVSARFTNAFAVTDTGASSFNAVYVFTFSAPADNIVVGRQVQYVTGNISKFVGFLELSFPRSQATDDDPDPSLLPAPIPLNDLSWSNNALMLGSVARQVTVTGRICNPTPPNPTGDSNIQNTIDSWNKFNQFVVDGDTTCQSTSNFVVALPAKKVGDFDPTQMSGATVTVTGMLRNSSGQNPETDADGLPISCASAPCAKGTCASDTMLCMKGPFNFWTVYPSSADDIQ